MHYNNFSAEEYRQDILRLLPSRDLTTASFVTFITKSKDAFDIKVPTMRKYRGSNKSPFINKKKLKSYHESNCLRNRFSIIKSNGDKEAYKKQRNY